MKKFNLLRSGFIVAVFTILSRVFGLLRELFISYLFGTNMVADSINVALKLPNLFRRILGEGALSSVFIPIFSSKLVTSKHSALEFSYSVIIILSMVLLGLVILLEFFMPQLMFILAPGFIKTSHDKFELTVLLCRITLPYMALISLTALIGGMLNSIGKFAAFAFVPVLLSIVIIAATILLQSYFAIEVAVAISFTIGGIMQLLFMTIALYRAKLWPKISKKIYDSDIKRLITNMGPATLSAGTLQINLFISQSIASFIPAAISVLSYADRIYQLPLSIIGITFSTILLPELSRMYQTQNIAEAQNIEVKSLKIGVLLSIPAAIGLLCLAHPIICIIYERGAFTSEATIKTAEALQMFALGLPAFILTKILLPVFYANKDTTTPFKTTLWTISANIILNLALMIPLKHIGIALGSSLASYFGLYFITKYANQYRRLPDKSFLAIYIIKVLLCGGIMAMLILAMRYYYEEYFYDDKIYVQVLSLSLSIIVAILGYLLTTRFFRLHNFKNLN